MDMMDYSGWSLDGDAQYDSQCSFIKQNPCKLNTNNHHIESNPWTKLPSIYLHNIRSLNHNKFYKLKRVAVNYDTLFLTGSWQDAQKGCSFHLENCVLLTWHRRRRHCGGAAVYVRESLTISKLPDFPDENISMYWFRFIQPSCHPIIFGVVYHPPGFARHKKDSIID